MTKLEKVLIDTHSLGYQKGLAEGRRITLQECIQRMSQSGMTNEKIRSILFSENSRG